MFCPNCGMKSEDNSAFCGNCGAALDTQQSSNVAQKAQPYPSEPAKVAVPTQNYPPAQPQYTQQPMQQSQQPPSQYPGGMYYGLTTRDYWMWFILGICTCGIASLVYFYHNFDDARKLERVLQQQRNVPYYVNQTSDPAMGIVLFFLCSPIAYIMKYNSLSNLASSYYPNEYIMRPATSGRLIGVWVGVFFSFIFGALFPPLFLLAIGLMFYTLYLDKQWQDVLNYYIIDVSRG